MIAVSFILANVCLIFSPAAQAQGVSNGTSGPFYSPLAASTTMNLPNHGGEMLAQTAASTPDGEVDLTPVRLPEKASALSNGTQAFKLNALYRLPSRMFFSMTCENTLRLETNVYQTSSNQHADMIYRVLPNLTLGYALTQKTRISANYFYLRDQYTNNAPTLTRNIHSIGFRADHDFYISPRTTLTTGFMARELLINPGQPALCDLLPSATIVRRVGTHGAIYGGVLGQIRFRKVFGEFQEGDQFYSSGGIYKTTNWTFLFDSTLVTNFGSRPLRGGPNNQVIILTMEAGRKIHPKLPVTAFVRAEPIFNMGANEATGFAGFNFRIFGGLRFELNKQAIFPIRLSDG